MRDGSRVWASYRKGPGLLEFNLATKKIKTLIGGPSGAYALSVFDLTTDQKRTMPIKEEYGGPAVITNDGRYVSLIGREGSLTTWDISTAKTTTSILTRIREMHTRVDFMTLANDDRWLVTAGNHRDIAIFDRTTLRLRLFTQNSSGAFYVEEVWIKGNRMISTNDTGVMYSGVIK